MYVPCAGTVTVNDPFALVDVVVCGDAGTAHGLVVPVCATSQLERTGTWPTVTVNPASAAPDTSSTAVPAIASADVVAVAVGVGEGAPDGMTLAAVVGGAAIPGALLPPPPPQAVSTTTNTKARTLRRIRSASARMARYIFPGRRHQRAGEQGHHLGDGNRDEGMRHLRHARGIIGA
jgi:hypothetical protein